MSSPIPLAAPDGTVYAYACGTCHNVHATTMQRPRAEVARLASESQRNAKRCCVCDCGAPEDPTTWMRKCRACYERERAEARAGRRRDDLEALAARGLRECDVCDGTGSLDVDDVDCGVCGGTWEVPL